MYYCCIVADFINHHQFVLLVYIATLLKHRILFHVYENQRYKYSLSFSSIIVTKASFFMGERCGRLMLKGNTNFSHCYSYGPRSWLPIDKLLIRNWPCNPVCSLCDQDFETALHLCLNRSYAKEVWHLVIKWHVWNGSAFASYWLWYIFTLGGLRFFNNNVFS